MLKDKIIVYAEPFNID